MGSPIRTSPDQSVLTAPRSFSQLATSFFAFLCLGIPTHALSSLTIKFPVAPAPFLTPLRLPPSPQASATRFRARFHPKEPTLWKSSFPIHIGLVLKLSERAFPLLAPIPRPGFPFPATEPSKRETHLQFFLPIILFNCQRSLPLHPQGVSSFGMPYAGKGTLSPPTGRKPSSTGTASLALRIESFSFRSSAESYLVWWA